MTFNATQIKKSKLPTQIRHEIALKSLRKEQPISTIATDYGCSRNTVYKQQSVAINAIDQAFNTSTDDDKVLFYVPVSKQTIYTMVVMLHLVCRSSFRGIITFLNSFLGFDISIGSITNIINRAAENADEINRSQGFAHKLTLIIPAMVMLGEYHYYFSKNRNTIQIPSLLMVPKV